MKYDMWTLGCLLLDFLTWYLLGFKVVMSDFADACLDTFGGLPFVEDKFFILYSDDDRVGAKLKPSVVNVSTY